MYVEEIKFSVVIFKNAFYFEIFAWKNFIYYAAVIKYYIRKLYELLMHSAVHIVPLFHYADQISSQLRNLRKHNFLQLRLN